MSDDAPVSSARGRGTPRPVALPTAVALAALAAIWWVAVPLEAACPAATAGGCSAGDRASAGVLWSVVVAVTWAAAVVVGTTAGHRRPWVARVALGTLVAVALVGFGAVQGSTGFVVP